MVGLLAFRKIGLHGLAWISLWAAPHCLAAQDETTPEVQDPVQTVASEPAPASKLLAEIQALMQEPFSLSQSNTLLETDLHTSPAGNQQLTGHWLWTAGQLSMNPDSQWVQPVAATCHLTVRMTVKVEPPVTLRWQFRRRSSSPLELQLHLPAQAQTTATVDKSADSNSSVSNLKAGWDWVQALPEGNLQIDRIATCWIPPSNADKVQTLQLTWRFRHGLFELFEQDNLWGQQHSDALDIITHPLNGWRLEVVQGKVQIHSCQSECQSLPPYLQVERKSEQLEALLKQQEKLMKLINNKKSEAALPLAWQHLAQVRDLDKMPTLLLMYAWRNLAMAVLLNHDLETADPIFQHAQKIALQLFGDDHPFVLDNDYMYCDVLRQLEQWHAICEVGGPAYQASSQNLGFNHRLTLGLFHLLFTALEKTDQDELLFDKLEEFLPRYDESNRNFNEVITDYWLVYALLLERRHDHVKTRQAYEKACQVYEQYQGKNAESTINCKLIFGRFLTDAGFAQVAEPILTEQLQLAELHFGLSHPLTQTALNNLGAAFLYQSKYSQARVIFLRSLQITEKIFPADSIVLGLAYQNLGTAFQYQGLSAEAEQLFKQAQAVYARSPDARQQEIDIQIELAFSYEQQKKYDDAEACLQAAWTKLNASLGPSHPQTLKVQWRLAHVYDCRDEWQRAAQLYEHCLHQLGTIYSEPHLELAQLHSFLGRIYCRLKQLDRAEHHLLAALAQRRHFWDDTHFSIAVNQSDLAEVRLLQQRWQEAETLLEQADTTFRHNRQWVATEGLERAFLTEQFYPKWHLTLLYWLTQQPTRAWQCWEQGLSQGLFDDLRQRQQLNSSELHELSQRLQAVERAIATAPATTAATTLAIWQQERRALQAEWARCQQAASQANHVEPLPSQVLSLSDLQAALLPHQAIVGWMDWRGQRAVLVRAEGEPIWISMPTPADAKETTESSETRWQELVEQLRTPPQSSCAADLATQTTAANMAQNRINPLLPHLAATKSLPVATHLFILPSAGLRGIPVELLVQPQVLQQAGATPPAAWHNTAGPVISYIPSGSVFLWLRQRRAQRQLAALKNAQEHGTTVPVGLLALGDPNFTGSPMQATRPAVRSQLLVKGVDAGGNAERAGIQPNDWILSYNGQPVEQTADLVAALKRAQRSVPKQKIPLQLRRANGTQETVQVEPGSLGLHIATPELLQFQREWNQRWQMERQAIAPLPGTRAEVLGLKALFEQSQQPVTLLLGDEASEQQLYGLQQSNQLQQFRFLHLATHGLADTQFPLKSHLILARSQLPEPFSQWQRGAAVFTGELTAETILRQWQLQADLVTLSACQSGLGRFSPSEGYLGFAQPLLLAGANSVVVSLWSVEDTATTLLMLRFYQNLLGQRPDLSQPLSKAAALHEAKQWLRTTTLQQWQEQFPDVLAGCGLQLTPTGSDGNRGLKLTPSTTATQPLPTTATKQSDSTNSDPLKHPEPNQNQARPFAHPFYWSGFILIGDWE